MLCMSRGCSLPPTIRNKSPDLRLRRSFDRETAEREIRLALAAGNVDQAQSFVELSAYCHLSIDPLLLDKVETALADERSLGTTMRGFIHGFWTGEANNTAAFAGDLASDMFYFGDFRDMVKETTYYATGQPYDPWVLGMSTAGVAATTATYFVGAGLPERVGLSLAKILRRSDRLNPALAIRISKAAENGAVVELVENAARIERRAGVQATLDSLALAEEPEDLARIQQLAAVKGTKTRAILKLFGRAAFRVGVSVWVLAKWLVIGTVATVSLLFWTLIAVFGFVGWLKALAGRIVRFFWPSASRATFA